MFTLEIIFRLMGIGAASGVLLSGNVLNVISDNAAYLYRFDVNSRETTRIALMERFTMEDIPKREKFDFESIAALGEDLYIFGSGSTPQRNMAVRVRDGKPELLDLSTLYHKMREIGGIATEDFNLERAAFANGLLYMLQRGNGPAARNGIFSCTAGLTPDDVSFTEVALPKYEGNAFGFTDMTIREGKLYFIAASEKALSTYEDGEIAGSLFGVIDIKSMSIEKIISLGAGHKFEGITFYAETAQSLEFLLCEDRDARADAAEIHRLSLKKQ